MVERDQVSISSWSSCPPAQLLLMSTVHAALTALHRCEELSPWVSAHPRTSFVPSDVVLLDKLLSEQLRECDMFVMCLEPVSRLHCIHVYSIAFCFDSH